MRHKGYLKPGFVGFRKAENGPPDFQVAPFLSRR